MPIDPSLSLLELPKQASELSKDPGCGAFLLCQVAQSVLALKGLDHRGEWAYLSVKEQELRGAGVKSSWSALETPNGPASLAA